MRSWESLKAIAKFLYVQRIRGFDSPAAPHFDAETEARFRQEIERCSFYLEFGSGGSTVVADAAGVEGLSIENDPYYAKAVRRALSPATKINLVAVNLGLTKGWGRLVATRPTPARLRRWRRYVDVPFQIVERMDTFPDFVLIDARFRVAAALETARRAQLRNVSCLIMIDDYEDRPQYRDLERFLREPERVGRSALFRVDRDGEVPLSAVENALSDPS